MPITATAIGLGGYSVIRLRLFPVIRLAVLGGYLAVNNCPTCIPLIMGIRDQSYRVGIDHVGL